MALNALERTWIEAFRAGKGSPTQGAGDPEDWLALCFFLLLEAGRMLRGSRYADARESLQIKLDGSPTTSLELDIEALLRDTMAIFDPHATVVGEETGGALPASGLAVVVDPVDGTWAFVTGTETFATTIAVFRDGRPFVGMVMSPATGEIAYATDEGRTRLVHLSVYGESDLAFYLPTRAREQAKILVNLHPSRAATSLVGVLYQTWKEDGIQMIRSPGGSPSWGLLEAAKGSFVYVNLWSERSAEPFDLVAGVMLVRRAGGEVIDLDGRPIDAIAHSGPFVAGVDDESRQKVIELARGVVRETD